MNLVTLNKVEFDWLRYLSRKAAKSVRFSFWIALRLNREREREKERERERERERELDARALS